MNWRDISEEITTSTLEATRSLLRQFDRGGIYALALFTSNDGARVSMAANTEKGHLAHLAAGARDGSNSPDEETYYRWSSSEWSVKGWDQPAFSGVNELLAQQERSDHDTRFGNRIEAMTAALVTVKETLGERLANVTASVTVTDSGVAETIENASASRINAPDLANPFLRRFL